jgi:hypothetical protein
VTLDKIKLILVSITLFSHLILVNFCKDIAFNNPLDPNASKEAAKIIRIIETILSGDGDICFDGEKIWKIDLSGNLTAIDRESGAVIRSFPTVPGSGICFYRGSIYLCNGQQENLLYVIDPLSTDILNRLSTQNLYPGFITVLDDLLIIYDMRSAGIFEYNPDTGDSNRLFDLSGINIGGLEIYQGDLLITDKNADSIYRFSLNGGIMGVVSSPTTGLSGIAIDGSNYIYLFMLDGNIYKVSLP